jgi:hypothetical protein
MRIQLVIVVQMTRDKMTRDKMTRDKMTRDKMTRDKMTRDKMTRDNKIKIICSNSIVHIIQTICLKKHLNKLFQQVCCSIYWKRFV